MAHVLLFDLVVNQTNQPRLGVSYLAPFNTGK